MCNGLGPVRVRRSKYPLLLTSSSVCTSGTAEVGNTAIHKVGQTGLLTGSTRCVVWAERTKRRPHWSRSEGCFPNGVPSLLHAPPPIHHPGLKGGPLMKDPLWPSTKLRNGARRRSFGHKARWGLILGPPTLRASSQLVLSVQLSVVRLVFS